jgi:hypothetical protein
MRSDLVGKPGWKRPLITYRFWNNDNIKMYVRE